MTTAIRPDDLSNPEELEFDVPDQQPVLADKPNRSMMRTLMYIIAGLMFTLTVAIIVIRGMSQPPLVEPTETTVDILSGSVERPEQAQPGIEQESDALDDVELDHVDTPLAQPTTVPEAAATQTQIGPTFEEIQETLSTFRSDLSQTKEEINSIREQLVIANKRINSNENTMQTIQSSLTDLRAKFEADFAAFNARVEKQIKSLSQKLTPKKPAAKKSPVALEQASPPFNLVSIAQWGSTNIATVFHNDKLQDIEPGAVIEGWKLYSATTETITVIRLRDGVRKIMRVGS